MGRRVGGMYVAFFFDKTHLVVVQPCIAKYVGFSRQIVGVVCHASR